jgi:hypothetical protein
MTGYGFRSMASTLLNELGWKPDAIERLFACRAIMCAPHTTTLSTCQSARGLIQRWADYLDGLASGATVVGMFGDKVAQAEARDAGGGGLSGDPGGGGSKGGFGPIKKPAHYPSAGNCPWGSPLNGLTYTVDLDSEKRLMWLKDAKKPARGLESNARSTVMPPKHRL